MAYKNNIFAKISKEELPKPQITFPQSPKPPSPFLHKRIKKLLELKHEQQNLTLQYDPKLQVLYGYYKQGIHTFAYVIYCDEINTHLTKETIIAKYQELKGLVSNHNLVPHQEHQLILDYYYLIAKGKVTISKYEKMLCQNEATFLHQLIDFKNYLNKCIDDYTQKKLYSKRITKDADKLTLAKTFIPPDFCIDTQAAHSTIALDKYVDTWMQEDSQKHLALFGDYGMGKTSFLRYYTHRIAQKILRGDMTQRFPVFISLTNTSLQHGGMDKAIGNFLAKNLEVNQALFEALVNQGKVLFLLDGFDEMGFIGTHNQRIKQFNAIRQLATKNNKILLSGRASYFRTDAELKEALNIKEGIALASEETYFERLALQPFTKYQIETSIEKYNYTIQEKTEYLAFIKKNKSISNLCTRPSMMHIVRDMLPTLLNDKVNQYLNAGQLMQKYIDEWIDRQFRKAIVGSIDDKATKKQLVLDFFRDLAAMYYEKGIEKMPAIDLKPLLQKHIQSLNLKNKQEEEGVEQELLVGFLIEIEQDEYRFVHKPFREYLVADKIVQNIEQETTKEGIFYTKWTNEITDFVYDRLPKTKWSGIPLLLQATTKSKWKAKPKGFLFHYFELFTVLGFCSCIFFIINLYSYTNDLDNQLIKKHISYLDSLNAIKMDSLFICSPTLDVKKIVLDLSSVKHRIGKINDTIQVVRIHDGSVYTFSDYKSIMSLITMYPKSLQTEDTLLCLNLKNLTDYLNKKSFKLTGFCKSINSTTLCDTVIIKDRRLLDKIFATILAYRQLTQLYKLEEFYLSEITPVFTDKNGKASIKLKNKSSVFMQDFDIARIKINIFCNKKGLRLSENFIFNKNFGISLNEIYNLNLFVNKMQNLHNNHSDYTVLKIILLCNIPISILLFSIFYFKIRRSNRFRFIAKSYYIALQKGEEGIPKKKRLLNLLERKYYRYDCSEFRK